MQHRKKPKCCCFTAESVINLQIYALDELPMSPWSATTVTSRGPHVSSSHGRLEDAVKMLQNSVARTSHEKKSLKQILNSKSYNHYGNSSKNVYQFIHLSPRKHITNYRNSCSSVSSSIETLPSPQPYIKDRQAPINRASAELSYILFESPQGNLAYSASRTLFRSAGHMHTNQPKLFSHQYYTNSTSNLVSVINVKGTAIQNTNQDTHHVTPKGLSLSARHPAYQQTKQFSSTSYTKVANHPIFAVDSNIPSPRAKKPIVNKLYTIPFNTMKTTTPPNTSYINSTNDNSPDNEMSTLSKLLTARLKAIVDTRKSTNTQFNEICNSLQSKQLILPIDKKISSNLQGSTSSPDVIRSSISQQLIPPPTDYYHPELLYIGNQPAPCAEVKRDVCSATVKHRLSLSNEETSPAKYSGYKRPSSYLKKQKKLHEAKRRHQTNCLKKSLKRQISSGKWLYIEQEPSKVNTINDIVNAE